MNGCDKECDVYTMAFHSVIRRNQIISFAGKWTEPGAPHGKRKKPDSERLDSPCKMQTQTKKGMEREEGTEEPVGENRGQERGMREEYDQSTLDEHRKMSHDTHCFVLLTYAHKSEIKRKGFQKVMILLIFLRSDSLQNSPVCRHCYAMSKDGVSHAKSTAKLQSRERAQLSSSPVGTAGEQEASSQVKK